MNNKIIPISNNCLITNYFNLNPKNIQYLNDLTSNSYSEYPFDNSFIIFKSINDILLIIFASQNKSIILFNLVNNKIINEIKNAHEYYVTNFRYHCDNVNKRDLIISVSGEDNNLKLWDITNFNCLLNIQKVYKNGYLYSACFLYENNNNYIITSKGLGDPDSIKIFDFKGNKKGELSNSSGDNIIFIDTYYDTKLSTNFIITGNIGFVKSYIFKEDKVYHKYNDGGNAFHRNINLYENNSKLSLLEICCDGNIRIWNFHSGELLKRIKVYDQPLFSICLWNDQYIFVGCEDGAILLIDLNKGCNIKTLIGHEDSVLTIRKLIHPIYGECLISKGVGNEQIKLWGIK